MQGHPAVLTPAMQVEHWMTLSRLSGVGLAGSVETDSAWVPAAQLFVMLGGFSVQQGAVPPLLAQEAILKSCSFVPTVTSFVTVQLGWPFTCWIVPATHFGLMSAPILFAMAVMELW